MCNIDNTARKMERVLRIVRDNIQPYEILDSYTILCYFAPCVCKEMGLWFAGDSFCTRCDELAYCDINDLQRQLSANAITCLCRM